MVVLKLLRSVGALIAGAPLAVSRAFRTEVQAAGERGRVYRGVDNAGRNPVPLGMVKTF